MISLSYPSFGRTPISAAQGLVDGLPAGRPDPGDNQPMEFSEVVRSRRMVRNYEPNRRPDRRLVAELIELASRAPSAGFSQGWHFLVLDEPADLDEFWRVTAAADQPADSWLRGMRTAPTLVVVVSEPEVYLDRYAEPDKGWTDRALSRWPVPYWDVDAGMASMLLLLGAVDRQLAACFFGVPADRVARVRDAFGIPADRNIVGVVSLGYPVADAKSPSLRRGRRPLDVIASFGRFGSSTSFT